MNSSRSTLNFNRHPRIQPGVEIQCDPQLLFQQGSTWRSGGHHDAWSVRVDAIKVVIDLG
jgi:hypothetical protein